MAQHPSLRSKEKSKQHRSVLKRYERLKELKEKEKWQEGDSIFGLPKLKILKFKLKKEKAAPAEEAVAEGVAATPVEGIKETQAKEASSAKASVDKTGGKEKTK